MNVHGWPLLDVLLVAFVAGFGWNGGAWVCAVVTGALSHAVGYRGREKP